MGFMHGCAGRTPSTGEPSLTVTSVPVPSPGSLTDYMALLGCREVSAARKQWLPFVGPLHKRFPEERGMFARCPRGYLRTRSFIFIQNYPIRQSYHYLPSGYVSTVTALLKKGATRLQFTGEKMTERMNLSICRDT